MRVSLMRLVMVWTMVSVVGTAFAANVFAQDDAQATIEAQATRISELETQVAELGGGQPMSTPVPGEKGAASPFLFGPGNDVLPVGPAGEVSIVVVGSYDGTLPVVLMNSTSESIGDIEISTTVRDATGALIGAGGSLGINPYEVAPGGYAIGYVYFDGVDFPAGAVFEFDVDYETISLMRYRGIYDAEVNEASFLGDRLVGEIVNPHEFELSGPISVNVMCFDADGQIIGFDTGYSEVDTLPAGDSTVFQVDFWNVDDCSLFVVAASGYDF